MGLGKTIQTAAFLRTLNDSFGNRGPFLVVAPLSTVVQWYREMSKWTDLNVVLYTGNAADRAMIREYEFAFITDRPDRLRGRQKYLKNCHKGMQYSSGKVWMMQVVITTPETLLSKDQDELMSVDWEMLIVDEAHNRLKSQSSKFAMCLRQENFLYRHCLLLTGTPIQNHMGELWTLLNVIDPNVFADLGYFLGRFGSMQGKERVDELHEVIRPYMLRRLKEDVEKNLPTKEETIIEVELTSFQKKYYRALYEKNREFLKHNKSGVDSANIVMELRKCCNHPFLLDGVEEKASQGIKRSSIQDEIDFLVKSSGKLVLLDKLLPKLKEGGHRVLIFSQFKIMLNVIEDYLILKEYLYERVDGGITGKKRQIAIDRFQNDSNTFAMLLTTKAGGVGENYQVSGHLSIQSAYSRLITLFSIKGINLTAADTCIIFDSDWNPQNDLQAQARCHRIGQTKSVKIYRFLTKKTYEMRLFHLGSMKMGLDKAVLQGVENKGEDALTAEDTERLLRFGAYEVLAEDGNEVESNSFMEEDIDTILMSRTKTRVHATNSINDFTFNKASFKASNDDLLEGSKECNVDIDDPDFWTKIFASSDLKEDGAIPPKSAPVVKEPIGSPEAECMSESTPSDDYDSNYEGEAAAQILSSRSITPRKCQPTKTSQKSANEGSLLGQEHADSNIITKIHADKEKTTANSTAANASLPVQKQSRPKVKVSVEKAITTPKGLSINSGMILPVAKSHLIIDKNDTTCDYSITSEHELQQAVVVGASRVVGNQRRRNTTRVELNNNGHETNSEIKINALKPEVIAIQTIPTRRRERPRKLDPMARINAETNNNVLEPEVIAVQTSQKIRRGRPKKQDPMAKSNDETKNDAVNPKGIAIQTSQKRRRGRPRKLDPMAKINDETKNNVVNPEVIAIQSSQKRPRGRPRKKYPGNDLDSKGPVPGRKRGRHPKILQVPSPTVGSGQQLHFEKSDILTKSKVNEKSRRKIKKPEYYEPQEIFQSPSKTIAHSVQNERKGAVGQTANLKVTNGVNREGLKRKRSCSVVEGAPKKESKDDRARTSQSLPRRQRRSDGDKNPYSWAFMGSSASVEQKQEMLPEDGKVKRNKRTQRFSSGSILENLLSSVD